MTRIKMCGVTRPEDAQAAAAAGATAIGMVFWQESPRAVDVGTARKIVAALPAGVPAIGVFVNQSATVINAIAEEAGLFGVQLHGDEPFEMIAEITRPVIRSVSLPAGPELESLPASVTVLLDTHDRERRGGTGKTIDWEAARLVAKRRPVLLAGGLTPLNVGQAIAAVGPYGVDVSSGIESAPGVKDHALIVAFVEAVRRADRTGGDTCE